MLGLLVTCLGFGFWVGYGLMVTIKDYSEVFELGLWFNQDSSHGLGRGRDYVDRLGQ